MVPRNSVPGTIWLQVMRDGMPQLITINAVMVPLPCVLVLFFQVFFFLSHYQ